MKIVEREEIASGGFGVVNKIIDDKDNVFAEKVFRPHESIRRDADLNKLKVRFKREVLIQANLSPDYFVPILAYDLEATTPRFIMPYAEYTFAHAIQEYRKDPSDPTRIYAALADILNSLEQLHDLDYVHRDLKPENILYHDGRWKLSDFGLVAIPSDSGSKLTTSFSKWGTELYCAPEQYSDFAHTPKQADIYSFGAILHDIFGDGPRTPFQHLTCSDKRIGYIISKCTEIDPKRRFPEVDSLRSTLLTALSLPAPEKTKDSTTDWVMQLDSIAEWGEEKLHRFVLWLAKDADKDDQNLIFKEFSEDLLKQIGMKDETLRDKIFSMYCAWSLGPFEFNYCDVIIRRLECVFELGTISIKSAVAITAAKLGRSHNRWFVMRKLMKMCGPELDESVAERIMLEMIASDVVWDFKACADQIQVSVEAYHPTIAGTVRKYYS